MYTCLFLSLSLPFRYPLPCPQNLCLSRNSGPTSSPLLSCGARSLITVACTRVNEGYLQEWGPLASGYATEGERSPSPQQQLTASRSSGRRGVWRAPSLSAVECWWAPSPAANFSCCELMTAVSTPCPEDISRHPPALRLSLFSLQFPGLWRGDVGVPVSTQQSRDQF